MSWGGGYVTDVAYMPGYFRQQSPLHLELACLLGGVAGIAPAADAPLSYLELGCGQGFGAMALAASCPAWTVTAIDFNPAHVAAARALAHAAGIGNVSFLEADLATLADDPAMRAVPEADIVSLHGVWSWVPQAVRDGIVRLLAARVRPGGLVHVSYNALPGWGPVLGMARTIREAGRRLPGRSDRQAAAGVGLAQALAQEGAAHIAPGLARQILGRLEKLPGEYVAHEYMNENWAPCFHADVVAALAPAKLDWVSSANLVENFPELVLTPGQQALRDQAEDPLLRELVKDMCLHRGLRADVFVRGARRISPAARDAALSGLRLALLRAPDSFAYEVEVPAGKAALPREAFGGVVEALAAGPRRLDELPQGPGAADGRNAAELVGVLVATDQAMVLGGAPEPPGEAARRFNALVARRLVQKDRLGASAALASGGTGAPMPGQMLDMLVHDRLLARGGEADAASLADELAADGSPEERAALRDIIEPVITQRVPAWRALAIL